jgi:hypothetical protein
VAIVRAIAVKRAATFWSHGREPTPGAAVPPVAPPISPRPEAKFVRPNPGEKERELIRSMTTKTHASEVAQAMTNV